MRVAGSMSEASSAVRQVLGLSNTAMEARPLAAQVDARTEHELELTSEGVRVESQDTTASFAWNRAKAVVDGAVAVELWFDPGVRVPNRAFLKAEERQCFIGFSRTMAPTVGTA